MKRPIYLSIVLAGSLALGGLLSVLPPLPFVLPSAQLACHGKGQCDLQQPLEKPPYFREDEGSLREMTLTQAIPGESDSHIEFKCLVEYNGWFRRIIRVKDVRVISKTKEFKGRIDYSIPDPNKIEIQAIGEFSTPNDASSFSNHEIISQPSQTNQPISLSEKGEANFASSSEASETQSVQFESNLKF